MSANTVEEMVLTVGDTEVKMRKSKKKKKRSSMIFITEERERTSTMDCKRVRWTFQIRRQETWKKKTGFCVAVVVAEAGVISVSF